MPHSTRARTSAGAALAVLASVVAGSLAGPAAAFPDKTVTRSNPGMIVIPEVGPAIPATSSIVVEPAERMPHDDVGSSGQQGLESLDHVIRPGTRRITVRARALAVAGKVDGENAEPLIHELAADPMPRPMIGHDAVNENGGSGS